VSKVVPQDEGNGGAREDEFDEIKGCDDGVLQPPGKELPYGMDADPEDGGEGLEGVLDYRG